MNSKPFRRALVMLGATALIAPIASCAPAEGADDQGIEISYLAWNHPDEIAMAEAIITAFEAENDGITVRLESLPVGTEGDNLVKTKLATGEMEDVFLYNSGAFLQSLNPDQTLITIDEEPWVGDYTDTMRSVVSTDAGVYGTPLGAGFAGAVMYNKVLYEELGLSVPATWDEFAANNDAIKAAGKTAVIQTYADPWSAQLLLLGDFGNVLAQDEGWADAFTANERRFVDLPALSGFDNLQIGYESGWWNEDFASATFDDGIEMLATGAGAHYPMLTSVVSAIQQNYPDAVENIGVFAVPARDANDTRLTLWMPNALYIPKTTEGPALAAVKKFLAFINSPSGCQIQGDIQPPSGPFGTTACSLPANVPGLVQDMQAYIEQERTAPAQEFVTPVKGPSLPEITVEVGSGIRSAADGAALYDQDVVKQAKQMGLPGW